MYIDIVPNRNSPPAILLRESIRVGRKVKKRTVANLSKLPQNVVAAIKSALQGTLSTAARMPAPESGPVFASLFALNEIADEIGLGKILGQNRLALLTKFLILARIAHQGSRLSAVRWARDYAVSEVMGLEKFDEDDLYEALDWAAANQAKIEDKLFKKYVDESGQPPTLILYDVTSSYFEGECNELAAFGYNRDGKKGKMQIVVGLLTSQDGEPLSVQVFRGNTADPQTVAQQIEKLAVRFGVKEIIFVGDRGMVKAKAKEALKAISFKYITALTDPQVRTLIGKDIIQPGLFDKTVVEVEDGEQRFILRRDDETFKKETHRREDKILRLKKKIDECNAKLSESPRAVPDTYVKRVEQWIARYKMSKFVTVAATDRSLALTLDEAGKANDALLDGCYVIVTNVTQNVLSSQQAHDHYKDLQHVERDFRRMKTALLEVRPIFVRKQARTEGHVFISMLALKIVRRMENALHKAFGTTESEGGETVESALTALSRICLDKYTFENQSVLMLPTPDKRQEIILTALNVKLKPPAQCTQ